LDVKEPLRHLYAPVRNPLGVGRVNRASTFFGARQAVHFFSYTIFFFIYNRCASTFANFVPFSFAFICLQLFALAKQQLFLLTQLQLFAEFHTVFYLANHLLAVFIVTMKFKHIFYRLRRSFRRKKGRKVSSKKNVNKSKIRLTSQESQSDAKPVKHVPIDELQRSVDSQDTSLFFTKLPIELRLKIYREVWANFLKSRPPIPGHPGTGFRLHIHSMEKAGSPFTHTPCKVQLENPGALMTAHGPDLLVFPGESQEHLPASYWSEWITKLHWGRHWACRKQNYRCLKTEAAPFLPLWLSCKRM
jgi:hypothetical protein